MSVVMLENARVVRAEPNKAVLEVNLGHPLLNCEVGSAIRLVTARGQVNILIRTKHVPDGDKVSLTIVPAGKKQQFAKIFEALKKALETESEIEYNAYP